MAISYTRQPSALHNTQKGAEISVPFLFAAAPSLGFVDLVVIEDRSEQAVGHVNCDIYCNKLIWGGKSP